MTTVIGTRVPRVKMPTTSARPIESTSGTQ